ncbi:MAG: TonB-dependent receptor [Marinilabiliaceae bacterium]|nr:TonB-dependent receptor [Marinilabiliaceae bacterium]
MRLIKVALLALTFVLFTNLTFSQSAPPKPLCSIQGNITAEGEALPFATVSIKSTTLGTASGADGDFELYHVPDGEYVVRIQALGFKPLEKSVTFKTGRPVELNVELESDVLGLEQIVVTADRNERKRTESSTIVNTLNPKTLENTEAISVGEGLNYVPGLRLENNCQNCGFTQLRINGMDGAHTQVLVNSRAIFSNLAGVYGLELLPSSMIDRIEVIRGGGSALYGSNAVAGTVNLITKDPLNNSYEVKMQQSFVGVGLDDADAESDRSINMNASIVSEDKKTGLSIFGFNRSKDPFDANDDGFSEGSKIENLTFGGRLYHRLDYRSKITADFIRVNENRRGGNMFDYPLHESDISEAVDHKITTGALTYERFVGAAGMWSVYGSAQQVDRASYYGAEQDLSAYGQSEGMTYNVGSQYSAEFGKNSLVTGIELVHDDLLDEKLGQKNIRPTTTITDQNINIIGAFAQFDRTFGPVKASLGARYDYYDIKDNENSDGDNDGHVLSPRATLLWNITPAFQWRTSYSQGYRAPQVFDEDLHIEVSGARKVIHENSDDLTVERSHSYMTSFDYNTQLGSWNIGLLAEGFYTKLNDAFAQEYGEADENGVVTKTRYNSEGGAVVKGINLEATLAPSSNLYFKGGYTIQSSNYEEGQEFGEKEFFRTPKDYGFFTIDYDVTPRICLIANGTYTGKMKVPYFGNTIADPEAGELRTSESFMDLGFKAEYDIKLAGLPFKLFGGVKNIFNSYQDDFDKGIDRDPAYIYGPGAPRTVYFGIKLSNLL